jgi:hypothetical protein
VCLSRCHIEKMSKERFSYIVRLPAELLHRSADMTQHRAAAHFLLRTHFHPSPLLLFCDPSTSIDTKKDPAALATTAHLWPGNR